MWDFEHEHFLQTSFGESACSVSWLPDNAHSVAVGTSMGWVKVYDTRTSNQHGASCSIMAHPAPRPRKIRGIRPDPFRPHLFATYSDYPGDVVKVWDLRKVSSPTSKAIVPPSFIVVPSAAAGGGGGGASVMSASFYGGGGAGSGFGMSNGNGAGAEAEAVVDVAWSTARPGVLAVATAVRKSVAFYSTATASGTSNVPLFSVCVPAPVQINGLAWQHLDPMHVLPQASKETSLSYAATNNAHNSPLQADRKSIIASMSAALSAHAGSSSSAPAAAALPSWESFRTEEELRMGTHSFVFKAGSHTGPSADSSHSTCGQPRLLAATVSASSSDSGAGIERTEGFAEVEVLDRIPLSISTAGGLLAVNTVRGRQVAISSKSINQLLCQQFQQGSACTLYKSTDVCDTMRLRCLAGYSADAYANIDVLAEELDAIYRDASAGDAAVALNHDDLLERAVANTKAVYRTWVWMDRFETTVNEAGLTVSNCGVQEVLLRNQLHLSATNVSKQFRTEVVHPILGATVYGSDGRDLGKKLCGWIKMFGLGKAEGLAGSAGELSRSSTATGRSGSATSVSPKAGAASTDWDTSADDDLLEVIVDEVFVESFERAAAIALWHGRLDLAVAVLRRAISQMEDGAASSDGEGTAMQTILWDAPFTPGYVQTVSLVAMCFAGYNFHVNKATDSSGANSPGGRNQGGASVSAKQSMASSASATWASMCKHVISQLLASRRDATGYLSAACHFLLSNLEGAGAGGNDAVAANYASIVDDRRLTLEDRVAFACTFLPDQAVNKWLERTVEQCISSGNIEGVIVTGLSDAGISILQKCIDMFDDVQTVALLVSRVIDSQNGSGPDSSAAHSTSNSGGIPSREWMWLHEYRSVLNKWEMFIERAYLDVELGKRYRRKAAMLAGAPGAGGPGKGGPTVVKKGPQKSQPALGQGSQSQQQKSKAGRVLYKLPVHSDYPHFYLRCGFCGASLPVDGMQNIRPEHLRLQNNVLHCCAACNKQLPRCYVCQLYMVSLHYKWLYSPFCTVALPVY